MTAIPFPDKQYSIIYADPPWSYTDKANAGKRGAGHKYPTQDPKWIEALPVASIAAPDCILFIWVTMPQLAVGLAVIKAWGFEFKTCAFTWIKMNKKQPTPFMGMGNWTRANAELCLLAVRGKPKRVNAGVRQVIMSPIETHSKKPAEIRDRIVTLMGDIPRIELFARACADGWDAWGNQVPEEIETKFTLHYGED